MTDIQRARDVLAKWRALYANPIWEAHEQPDGLLAVVDSEQSTVAASVAPEDAALIVGTAGNPDLLDAIDGLFDVLPQGERVTLWAERIAAAILSADQRMNA